MKATSAMGRLLGQHFLISRSVLAKIIQAAELKETDVVLEIGPGTGVLTRALAERVSCVLAVEKDRVLAERLRHDFTAWPNVEIIAADIRTYLDSLKNKSVPPIRLEQEAENTRSEEKSQTPGKVVANIPYYLTSRLIRILLEHEPPPELIILMVQLEVAERITAKPPKMNLLALSVQFYGEPKIIAVVPPSAFRPAPKVESAIIRIRPYQKRSNADSAKTFFTLVRAGFAQKRKTLLNNLAAKLTIPKERVAELLKISGITPSGRAETLTLTQWQRLTALFTTNE